MIKVKLICFFKIVRWCRDECPGVRLQWTGQEIPQHAASNVVGLLTLPAAAASGVLFVLGGSTGFCSSGDHIFLLPKREMGESILPSCQRRLSPGSLSRWYILWQLTSSSVELGCRNRPQPIWNMLSQYMVVSLAFHTLSVKVSRSLSSATTSTPVPCETDKSPRPVGYWQATNGNTNYRFAVANMKLQWTVQSGKIL